jgi:hypothetical protein
LFYTINKYELGIVDVMVKVNNYEGEYGIEKEVTVNVSAEKLWDIIGLGFSDCHLYFPLFSQF